MNMAPSIPRRAPSIPQRWRGPLALGFAVLAMAALLILLSFWRSSSGWGFDFSAYFDAARRLVFTGSPYQASTLEGPFRPGPYGLYMYAPTFAVLLQPLTGLPFEIATLLWLVFRLGLLVATCALMPVSTPIRFATFGLVAITPPILEDMNLGNVSLIVTFLAVLAWRYTDKPAGGFALAAAVLLRPAMAAIGLSRLLARRYATVIWTVVGGLVLVAVSLPFVGLKGWLDYVTVVRHLSDVTGVKRNFDTASLALHLGAPSWVVTGLLLGGYVLAIAAILYSLRRDSDVQFVVALGASLLLSPLLWNHYFTHIIVTGAFLAHRGRRWAIFFPLVTWLPQELLGFTAVAATLLPFAAREAAQVGATFQRAMTAINVDRPAVQMTGDAMTTATGSVHRRFPRAPHTTIAAAIGKRTRRGIGNSALG
jgi:hypothetical protein